MTLKLDTQATQLLSFVQQQTSRIDAQLEAKITAKATEVGKPLDKAQLEQLLTQAMPEHKDTIKKLGEHCIGHHSDGTNGAFITQMVGLHRIEKDRNAIYTAPQVTRPARDPLFAKFIMAKEADVMLLFNASKFDDAGRPLLMKIVARESMKDKLPDLSNYHTLTKTPDVLYVANDAAFVDLQDENEAEFSFGDAIAQVSLNGKGKELSRGGAVGPTNQQVLRLFYPMNGPNGLEPNLTQPSGHAPQVTTGANLDTFAVQRYEDRIELAMNAKPEFAKGGWLEQPAASVEAKLTVQPGYLLEPGSNGRISFLNSTLDTNVGADDFSFIGSGSTSGEIATASSGLTLGQLLQQNVRQQAWSTSSGGADRALVDRPAYQLLFAKPENVEIGGAALQPLGDRTLNKADFAAAKVKAHVEPLVGDPEKNGQKIVLDLGKGFLAGKNGESMAGWRIEAGYFGGASQNGEWVGTNAVTAGADGSPSKCLTLNLPNAPEALAANRNLEIRVYNAQGVPAQRVLIPMTQLSWG